MKTCPLSDTIGTGDFFIGWIYIMIKILIPILFNTDKNHLKGLTSNRGIVVTVKNVPYRIIYQIVSRARVIFIPQFDKNLQ